MSFVDEQNKLLRRKIDYVEIDMDFCDNVYGVSPCTAADSIKCYNTFFTCKDPANFAKIIKTYKFINHDIPASTRAYYFPAKPTIKNVNDLPTEIKEADTVTRRLKIEIYDEPDNDVGVDPYWSQRNKIQGTFWKKFLARNPNYRNRIIRYYEGYEGLDTADFQMRFIGKLENITIEKGYVVIEAVDLMKKLSETEYPLKTDISLAENMPMMFEAYTDDEMIQLNAFKNDFCERRDWLAMSFAIIQSEDNIGGILTPGDYYYTIIAYDANGRALARKQSYVHTLTVSYNSIRIAWNLFAGATQYRIFGRSENQKGIIGIANDPTDEFTDLGTFNVGFLEPQDAQRIYQLSSDDPTTLGDWILYTSDLTIDVDDASEMNSSGTIKMDKEIISYTGISTNTLTGLTRGKYDSEVSRHDEGTNIFIYLLYAADNPFTIMMDMLDNIGVTSTYRTTKFDDYEAAWSGPNFGLLINTKDTKLNKLFFQLVNAVDCMCFQNEEGKVDILSHAEIPASFEYLNDRANFIHGSGSVDENDASRYTDAVLYWNNFDPDKAIEEKDGFNRINISDDADARSPNEYGDERYDLQYCIWLNLAFDAAATIDAYVNSLLDKRRQRHRDPQALLTEDVEIKDSSLKVGQIVFISTNEIQDIHGNDIKDTAFRIIKKTPKKNKITIVFKRLYSATDTLKAETGADLLNEDTNPLLSELFS
jgi:hypothetical protein